MMKICIERLLRRLMQAVACTMIPANGLQVDRATPHDSFVSRVIATRYRRALSPRSRNNRKILANIGAIGFYNLPRDTLTAKVAGAMRALIPLEDD